MSFIFSNLFVIFTHNLTTNKNNMSTTTDVKKALLTMVTAENNNKFYNMTDQGDGTFLAEYGRIQGDDLNSKKGVQRKSYPMSKWDSTLRSKVKKGYTDQTGLVKVEKVSKNKKDVDLFDISDREVKRIIKLLDGYAKGSVEENYSISSASVTEAMVNKAQEHIDTLRSLAVIGTNKQDFNKALLQIFGVIRRKMGQVNDYLLDVDITDQDSLDKAINLVTKEQDTIDPLRTQVQMNYAMVDDSEEDSEEDQEQIDILKLMGIEMTNVTDAKEIAKIKKLMGPEANLFKSAFKVKNSKTEAEFDKWVANAKDKKIELFWHGSRNENWTSILTSGLVLRPTNAVISGKMYGFGTYFADKFKKSLGYTSLRGSYWASGSSNKAFLSLYKVHVGNQLKFKHHQSWCYDLTETNLKKRGDYDSIWAVGGADLRNDEFIVYNQAQTTVEYIVEVER